MADQKKASPFAPRCIKDQIEEQIFFHRRDLFTELDLVFFDTTSIYFEGKGGQRIGERGYSKDHRPDLKQMIVGVGVTSKDPSPLKVKQVELNGHRYIVCVNSRQARKGATDRETILAALKEQLKKGAKSIVGKKGYRKYRVSWAAAFRRPLHTHVRFSGIHLFDDQPSQSRPSILCLGSNI